MGIMKNQTPYQGGESKLDVGVSGEDEKPILTLKAFILVIVGIAIAGAILLWYYLNQTPPASTTTPTITSITTSTTTMPLQELFSESFEKDWEVVSGKWELVRNDDAYSPPNVLKTDSGRIFTAGGENWEDYIAEIKGRLLKKEWGYGLMFRVQKTETFYRFYSCQYDPGAGGIVLNKEGDGGEVTLQGVKFDTDTEWHTLKVEVKGSEFKCYVDDELMITAADDEFTQGKVGIEVWGTETYFDDIVVKPA